jgi:UDP-glucose 4-epimerase
MNIEGKKIFITGGAGFIGSELIGRLIDRNQVTVYDTFRRDSIHYKPYIKSRNLTLVHGDVCDMEALEKAMKGSNIVIHARSGRHRHGHREPGDHHEGEHSGHLQRAGMRQGLKKCERVILFSTSRSSAPSLRSAEDSYTHAGPVGEARWTYAVSKLAGEHMSYAYFKEFGLPTVTVRPFNIYGPGQTAREP